MKIIEIATDRLVPYAKNTKKHDKVQIDNVAKSIEKYGFVQPIVVDKNNVVVIGHCRLLASKKLGLKTVPCVKAEDLNEEQINALRIVDNKSNESEWDNDLLLQELQSVDLSFFDFDFGFDDKPKDEVEEVDVPVDVPSRVSGPGELWRLGDHVLLCGDSTRLESLHLLMGDDLADCVCTDPPYNMKYEGGGRTRDEMVRPILNDHMTDDLFEKFLASVYACMYDGMRDGAACYVFYKELGRGVFITEMLKSQLKFRQEIMWVKNNHVLGGCHYQNMYEPCLYGQKGKRAKWYGKRTKRSVIESIDLMTVEELKDTIRALTEETPTDVIREKSRRLVICTRP